MIVLIEIIQQVLQVKILSGSLKKKGYEFPMKVGDFSCDTHSNAKNMMIFLKKKYKLDMYEVLWPMFNPHGYARDVMKIRSVITCISPQLNIYWADCKDEFESHHQAFPRSTVDQVKMYKLKIDVYGVKDGGHNIYVNTYLTKLRNSPISSEPFEDAIEDLDIMMAKIDKRTGE